MQAGKFKVGAKDIAILGVFSALAVVSSMWLTLRIGEFIKISPVFLVVALAAGMYGVFGAAIVAFISDLLQALMAGLGFSPLISAVNVLSAVVFGILLYNSKSVKRIVMAVLIRQLICGLLLNTLALKIYYGTPFVPMIYLRAVQCAVLIVTEISVLWLVLVVLDLPSRLKKN